MVILKTINVKTNILILNPQISKCFSCRLCNINYFPIIAALNVFNITKCLAFKPEGIFAVSADKF